MSRANDQTIGRRFPGGKLLPPDAPPVIPDTTPPSVAVEFPSGGERFSPGQPITIRWRSGDDVAAQDVLFSATGGAPFEIIAGNLPGSRQSFDWTVPNRPTGQGLIRVVARDRAGNQAGDRSDAVFTIQAAPSGPGLTLDAGPDVTGFTPVLGPQRTTQVTINGTNFKRGDTVMFGGVKAGNVDYGAVGNGVIRAFVPAGAKTAAISVSRVVNRSTLEDTSGTEFLVTPTITDFNPKLGSRGNVTVVLTGTGLDDGTTVTFTGTLRPVPATITGRSDTQLGVTVPECTPEGNCPVDGPITVTTRGGSAVTAQGFDIRPQAPNIRDRNGLVDRQNNPRRSGPAGTEVIVLAAEGTRFEEIAPFDERLMKGGVSFRIKQAARFTVSGNGERIMAIVPTGAVSGPIRVANVTGSDMSSEEFVVTDRRPDPPGALTAVARNAKKINLSWTRSGDNENGFKVERKDGAHGAFRVIKTVARKVTIFSDEDVRAGIAYTYRIRAFNDAFGDSQPSNEAGVTLPGTAPLPLPVVPPAITGFTPASGATGTRVLLSGAGFEQADDVRLGDRSVPFLVDSPTAITIVVPQDATGGPFLVTTGAGAARSAQSFLVLDPDAPTGAPVDLPAGRRRSPGLRPRAAPSKQG